MTAAAPSTLRIPLKRRAILDAALALMSERTFHGTPMPAIAAAAGVAAGTLYRYFPGKEALVNALYRECKGAMGAHLARGIDPASPHRQQFRGLWRGLGGFAREQRSAFRFLETHHHGAYLDEESLRAAERVHAPIRAFVERAQAAGAVRPGDPDVLIALAFGAFVGLVKESDQGRYELDDTALEGAEQAVWALLRGPEGHED